MLTAEFETVALTNKATGEVKVVGDHYGNPSCGAICESERFCVTGGEGIVFSDFSNRLIYAFRFNPQTYIDIFEFQSRREERWIKGLATTETLFVHALSLENSDQVRVLLDPWSSYASTWHLNIKNKRIVMLQKGPDLRGQPWRKAVDF